MKKRFGLIATLILTIICMTMSGCIFLRDPGYLGDLPDSNVAAENVVLETLTSQTGGGIQERQKMDMVDAVALVERSSVAINTTSGAGSGVLIDVSIDGTQTESSNYVYILTCFHVISDKGVINVILPDKDFSYKNNDYVFAGVVGNSTIPPYYLGNSEYTMECAVTLVGGDQESDIAVLKLDLSKNAYSGKTLSVNDIVTAKIAPTDYKVSRGETVFAVGNPTGTLPGSVSSGTISYLERDISIEGPVDMTLMQTTVDINPGNSGGGLYNLYGELIGITNAGLVGQSGINFAIPASVMVNGVDNGFVNIARNLIATCNSYNYGYVSGRQIKLGITVSKMTESGQEYVFLAKITSGSLAEQQGLKVNDVVKKININGNDYDITSYSLFKQLMSNLKFGDLIQITVSRTSGFLPIEKTAEFQIKQFVFCDTGIYAPAE